MALNEQELTELLAKAMREAEVPGASAAVLQDGHVVVAHTGVTSVVTRVPVTPDTAFQIGSITKPLTATAIMRLVEDGRLDPAAPVRDLLPGLRLGDREAQQAVTVEDLLTHRGGWTGDDLRDTGAGADALGRYVTELESLEQIVPPGTEFSYSNSGFSVLGAVIEAVTGTGYEAALSELVLAPLGLDGVAFGAADVIARRFAVGHDRADGAMQVATPWELPRSIWPAGGAAMTATELLTFAASLWGEARAPVLSDAAREQMATPVADAVGGQYLADEVGLGWMLCERSGVPLLSHTGGVVGQKAILACAPSRRFAVAVLTNAGHAGLAAERVARQALLAGIGVDVSAPAAESATLPAGLPGLYSSSLSEITVTAQGDGGMEIELRPKGWAEQQPPAVEVQRARLIATGPDELRAVGEGSEGLRGRAVRDGDAVRHLRIEGRLATRLGDAEPGPA